MDLTRRSLLQLLGAGSAALALRRSAATPAPGDDAETLRPTRNTRFANFLRSRGIRPTQLARESGYSRQYLLRLRLGRVLPSRMSIAVLTITLRRITREHVLPSDLFEPDVLRAAREDPPA